MDIKGFWDAVLRQDADQIRDCFCMDAYINWHCTDEHFTVEEYIRANCEYPGEWDGEDDGTTPQWRLEKKIGCKIPLTAKKFPSTALE